VPTSHGTASVCGQLKFQELQILSVLLGSLSRVLQLRLLLASRSPGDWPPGIGGNVYATEGAHAALAFGFDEVRLDAIVSFTVPANVPSIRVMERIGMKRVIGGDFNHPNLPEGHPLRRHALYCLTRTDWLRLPLLAQPWSTPPR
jgi:GNAT acetyltransferase-like protein